MTFSSVWNEGLPYFYFVLAILLSSGLIRLLSGAGTPSRFSAWAQSAFWFLFATAFAVFTSYTHTRQDALTFATGYLVEQALSLDNLFVFLLIFEQFRITPEQQPRILSWGLFGAIIMRALFIGLGATLIRRFESILIGLGLVLAAMGVKLIWQGPAKDSEGAEKTESPAGEKWLARIFPFPLVKDDPTSSFFVRRDGRLMGTSMLMALILIELGDILFAVDSVPAIFGITQDPWLIFTSNLLAIVGLRALFFVMTDLVRRLYYLKVGLGAILVFVGAKLAGNAWLELSPLASLVIIASILTATVACSAGAQRKKPLQD